MKINLFIDCLGAGGAQRQLVGLAIMLKEYGHDVKVSTYYDDDFYKRQLDDAGVLNELIPGAANTKKRILAVRSYFKRERPDWVIAYQETPSLVACAARVLGCKYKLIVSERNTTQVVGMNERVRFLLYHWADAIVPNSFAQERWLSKHHPWMKKKLTTISNFVDLQQFTPDEDHQRHDVPYIMVAASVWASKNTLGLIEAAHILKEEGTPCLFRWFGKVDKWQNYYDECQQLIVKYGLQDSFELLPKSNEIYKKYQEADYFCLPSFYEGTPNVLCEAISCGLPVMVSDVCDNALYAQKDKNAVLFNPNNPNDIAVKIKMMLGQSDEEYQKCKKMSRKIAEDKLSSETFVTNYINILNK